jgi:hypothetical protein
MQLIESVRIAMWSGPRNISTAMMRAWENRSDCVVWDEPLYGYYLSSTGIDHPGAKQVIEAQGTDWRNIVERCIDDPPNDKRIFYQKHMTLHLLPDMDRQWLSSLTNCFLIREPEPVIASYAAVREDVSLDDIGFVQQAELFDYVTQISGSIPLVIDSRDFLLNPQSMLRKICIHLDVEFESNMLLWPTGARESDGVWGKYWYESVWKSSGFAPYHERPLSLDPKQQSIADQARPFYDQLYQHRLL